MAADHEWESNGVRFKSIKVGSHWYSMRIAEPKPLPRAGEVAVWMLSGRWRCACGRRHRPYIRSCGCGGKGPDGSSPVSGAS
jgi:hypothetical protein